MAKAMFVRFEMPKELSDKAYEIVEVARKHDARGPCRHDLEEPATIGLYIHHRISFSWPSAAACAGAPGATSG